MKWLHSLLHGEKSYPVQALVMLRGKFTHFQRLLDQNNVVLKIISDMEEKESEEFLFDMNYIRVCLAGLMNGVEAIVDSLVALSGDKYKTLKFRFEEIKNSIGLVIPGSMSISRDELTIPLRALHNDRTWSVGSKNAHLGELKVKLKLPVPGGFAITAWAYKLFMDANDLQRKITERIASLNIQSYEDLERVSEKIQATVLRSPLPAELEEAIIVASADLIDCRGKDRFSMRSSAIGEDTQFSFAGQYATYLNVRSDELVKRYRQVVASKFTPKAIYYLLSHSLNESELAMSVGCVEMVDAVVSGVVYTRNPVDPDDDRMIISSIYGLGRYLVDGIINPDVIWVSRKTREVTNEHAADKPVRLIAHPNGGTVEEQVPQAQRGQLSIGMGHLKELIDYSLQIEEHYASPQDIEWSIDQSGDLYFLQSRPLRLITPQKSSKMPDMSGFRVLYSGGETVCPGAGGGEVFRVLKREDLQHVPNGAVLVTTRSFPGLVTVMERVNALVAEVGGVASHMATLAREYMLPTLVDIEDLDSFPNGLKITVDATEKCIYAGIADELIAAKHGGDSMFDDMPVMQVMRRLLQKIAPLNLLQPESEDFKPEKCMTLHDITRFAHQKAMVEMFSGASELDTESGFCNLLKTSIPLTVKILIIDEKAEEFSRRSWISEKEIHSRPMRSFWDGILREGWPSHDPPDNIRGLSADRSDRKSRSDSSTFEESSYAVISEEYMVFSLHLGYHYTTIESMCTNEVNKNYIRFQHKGGGASIERRIHRVNLINTILSAVGFAISSKADFLDARLDYSDKEVILSRLWLLGRLVMRTKQLDMALSNEAITQWYAKDIMQHLGLTEDSRAPGAEGN